MFITKKHISRRAVLKGAGVTLALPFLDAMVPARTALSQTAAVPKLRMGFFYMPHGAIMYNTPHGAAMDSWTPSGSGANFKLSPILAPLEKYKDKATFQMVYVREAHPLDGWKMESNTRAGVSTNQPKSLAERTAVCTQFCERVKPTMPVAVANIAQVISVATASAPGMFFIDTCSAWNSRSRILARSTRYPMNRNNGTAVSTSFDVTSNVFCTSNVKMRLAKKS